METESPERKTAPAPLRIPIDRKEAKALLRKLGWVVTEMLDSLSAVHPRHPGHFLHMGMHDWADYENEQRTAMRMLGGSIGSLAGHVEGLHEAEPPRTVEQVKSEIAALEAELRELESGKRNRTGRKGGSR